MSKIFEQGSGIRFLGYKNRQGVNARVELLGLLEDARRTRDYHGMLGVALMYEAAGKKNKADDIRKEADEMVTR